MNQQLPFFNWSLKKAQDTEPDSFIKARIHIIYILLLFSISKAFIVICIGAFNEQWLQVPRAIVAFVLYAVFLKLLLYRPSLLRQIAQTMILFGILIVWTNIFVYAHKINLLSLQFVFMIILSSFYILGNSLGIVYSIISTLPVVLFLVSGGTGTVALSNGPQEFASPGYEIIVVLNFVSIIIAHYLFFEAFRVNLREKERLNQQLLLSVEDAHKLAASKSNFLSTMSHELRTPLNSVVGVTEMLLEDKPQERQMENLKILKFSALDLLSLINNVLDFSKIESDKLILETVPVRLAEFMQNICAVLRIKARTRDLDLVLDIDQELGKICVISDPTRLSQVMYNLIGNAIKFTEKGSIIVKLTLVKRTGHTANILFSVADTGIGIPPEKHESIFELFEQAGSNIVRKYGGSGLGLAIVKKILLLFNSEIELESTVGKGSNFFFTIPFVTTADAEEPGATAPEGGADFSHLRILIAEDNPINKMIMGKQLERLNITPVMVENGEQAYDAYLADNYDAVLLDLHMPILGGYETAKLIRALPDAAKANVYLIAFTASVTEQERIVAAGFDDYLYKPVSMNELKSRVEKIASRLVKL